MREFFESLGSYGSDLKALHEEKPLRTFALFVDCDNAAFQDNPGELADILEFAATQLRDTGQTPSVLRDHNGNTVGSAGYIERVKAPLEAANGT